MKWINPALSVTAIIMSAYFGYLTSQLLAMTKDKSDDSHNNKMCLASKH